MATKKIFRYKVGDIPQNYTDDELEAVLRSYGADGWELVAVHELNGTHWRYVFKAEL